MKPYLSKMIKKVVKNKKAILPSITMSSITMCAATIITVSVIGDANAVIPAGAVPLPFMDALKATLAATIQGTGSYIIDAVAIVVGGFMTAKTSSPAPLILSIVSALLFEICVKIFIH